jgi:hypothetical protein
MQAAQHAGGPSRGQHAPLFWLVAEISEYVAVPPGIVHEIADDGRRDGDLQEHDQELLHVIRRRQFGARVRHSSFAIFCFTPDFS